MRWCFDTSALIEPWVRHYPPEMFEPLWDKLKELAESGTIAAPVDVRIELERQSDNLCKWAKALDNFFVDTDRALLQKSKDIIIAHAGFIDPKSTRSGADPFVVALAEISGVPVVTYETMGKAKTPKIPNVCRARGIRVASFVEVLRAEGFKL
ncbi:MAG TPA: DUF4411 family protein [Burkholderiales bacterium]|nr:DUF4411 family protein [Burkholderiales bacterium]